MGVENPESLRGFGLGLTTDIEYVDQEEALHPQRKEDGADQPPYDPEAENITLDFSVARKLGLNNYNQVGPGRYADKPRRTRDSE